LDDPEEESIRGIKVVAVVSIFLLSVAVLLNAGQNKFGVADEQKTVFSHSVQVGETLLPKGEYKIRHTMEGAVHVMVFTQLKASNPATAAREVPDSVRRKEDRADLLRLSEVRHKRLPPPGDGVQARHRQARLLADC